MSSTFFGIVYVDGGENEDNGRIHPRDGLSVG